MVRVLDVGISPCPNDTFIFGSLALGLVPELPGHDSEIAWRFAWEDVQTLNELAGQGRFDVVKLSAAAALRPDIADGYAVLSSGGAFGLDGAGPKLVTRPGFVGEPRTVAVPGLETTAFALLRLALGKGGDAFEPVPMVYDAIKDAVLDGRVEAGLLIHETALVYARHGLALRLDLGRWWAERTGGLPLPLGVIAARRELGDKVVRSIDERIRLSLETARRDPAPVWPLVRSLAQELDDDTLDRHIRAYVNAFSLDMGRAGRAALDRLSGPL